LANNKIVFLILISSVFSLFIPSTALAQNQPFVLSHFNAKGIITENNPFGGMVLWTIINGEKGTVIISSTNGVGVIRLDMTQSDSCEESSEIVCLDGIITEVKNTQFTKVGDKGNFVFEVPYKEKISILSGDLASLEIDIDVKKMRIKDVSKIVEQEVHEDPDEELRQEAWSKLQGALELTKDPQIIQILKDSNNQFNSLESPYELIEQRNEEWISTDKDELNPFMGTVIANGVSDLLRTIMDEDKTSTEDFVYEEIILTNAFGANVAQTGKTSDYQQDDEQWWLLGKNNGVYFESGYDESAGVQSLDMSVRILDENDRFLGVIKFVINTEKLN